MFPVLFHVGSSARMGVSGEKKKPKKKKTKKQNKTKQSKSKSKRKRRTRGKKNRKRLILSVIPRFFSWNFTWVFFSQEPLNWKIARKEQEKKDNKSKNRKSLKINQAGFGFWEQTRGSGSDMEKPGQNSTRCHS